MHEAIAYHDCCYIDRYNNIYDINRQILKTIPGVNVLEMERNKQDAMCCDVGGGMMWMKETQGKRVNLKLSRHFISFQLRLEAIALIV